MLSINGGTYQPSDDSHCEEGNRHFLSTNPNVSDPWLSPPPLDFTVYKKDGLEPSQMEDHPVALALTSRSLKS